jgi:uncharacterized membrane protein YhiD involved in acid resistance
MPDWMQRTFDDPAPIAWDVLLIRLTLSLVFGMGVAGLYRATRGSSNITATFPATLVLLAVLIAMVTQVIGDNVARAFSLVGALSIVRFRTVVQDTIDTAFVIFAVAVGMAIGAGQPTVAVFGMATVGIAAVLLRDRPTATTPAHRDMLLLIRLGWSPETESLILSTLAKHATDVEPLSASTVRHGAAMELSFRVRLLPAATLTQLVSELNRVESVQSVELRRQS